MWRAGRTTARRYVPFTRWCQNVKRRWSDVVWYKNPRASACIDKRCIQYLWPMCTWCTWCTWVLMQICFWTFGDIKHKSRSYQHNVNCGVCFFMKYVFYFITLYHFPAVKFCNYSVCPLEGNTITLSVCYSTSSFCTGHNGQLLWLLSLPMTQWDPGQSVHQWDLQNQWMIQKIQITLTTLAKM